MIRQSGRVYRFPKNGDGEIVYCNLEGVSWISAQQLVVVSDASKLAQPASCREKDQSIHWVSVEGLEPAKPKAGGLHR